jgi:hypothetical protein
MRRFVSWFSPDRIGAGMWHERSLRDAHPFRRVMGVGAILVSRAYHRYNRGQIGCVMGTLY